MRLTFEGEPAGLAEGIRELAADLRVETGYDGIPVRVVQQQGPIEVNFHDGKGYIAYPHKIHFFRALGLFVEALRHEKAFAITETPQFVMNGAMFDMSRNAVMTVASVKLMLRKMALMGLNMMMLYTEDTYTIPDRPYFGYMRGKYSASEFKACDDYADLFGIEIIPCIQTLAHLKMALKWDYASQLKDTDDILLVGNEQVYGFIEEMLQAASASFRSRRIHLGMDEAHHLGLGRYLEINGYRKRREIFREHVQKVTAIAKRLGLRPMIWSDMYMNAGAADGDYYASRNDADDDAELVYWDYFRNESDVYRAQLQLHKKTARSILFSSCIWTWTGFGTNYGKTFATVEAGLKACKDEGIKEVFTTVWLNYGAETNVFSSLLGLQLHAEHGYAETPDMEKLARRFEFCAGANYSSFVDLKDLDETPGTDSGNLLALNSDGLHPANPSHYLLWQDPLLGLFDRHIAELDVADHYAQLRSVMERHVSENPAWTCVFEVPWKLADVLSVKSGLGLRIKRLYDNGDHKGLQSIVQYDLPGLREKITELRAAHMKQWFGTYKPFGWEVLDIRYGGLLQRIDTTIRRLADYTGKRIEKIDELEEERLCAVDATGDSKATQCFFCFYNRIVTACTTD